MGLFYLLLKYGCWNFHPNCGFTKFFFSADQLLDHWFWICCLALVSLLCLLDEALFVSVKGFSFPTVFLVRSLLCTKYTSHLLLLYTVISKACPFSAKLLIFKMTLKTNRNFLVNKHHWAFFNINFDSPCLLKCLFGILHLNWLLIKLNQYLQICTWIAWLFLASLNTPAIFILKNLAALAFLILL